MPIISDSKKGNYHFLLGVGWVGGGGDCFHPCFISCRQSQAECHERRRKLTHLNISPLVRLGGGLEVNDDIWVVHHDRVSPWQLNAFVPVVTLNSIFELSLGNTPQKYVK